MPENKNKYKGVIVPMITPFNEDLSIDNSAVVRILHSFLEAKVTPFILGTTGESVSISNNQALELVKLVVEYISKREIVYAGISGNCLKESVENAKKYVDLGVDAVVAHLPFYYPMSPTQMLGYYEELADKVPCPLFLYNNPITTKFSVPIEVIDKLSYHPNIVGLKDSERGLERLDIALELWANRKDFTHFLGWAAQSAYALQKGSDGIVPSTANLTPKLYRELYEAAKAGNTDLALKLQLKTNRISEVYQKNRNISESIPALKVMMSDYGLCDPYVMPPMYMYNDDEQKIIKSIAKIELTDINI